MSFEYPENLTPKQWHAALVRQSNAVVWQFGAAVVAGYAGFMAHKTFSAPGGWSPDVAGPMLLWGLSLALMHGSWSASRRLFRLERAALRATALAGWRGPSSTRGHGVAAATPTERR